MLRLLRETGLLVRIRLRTKVEPDVVGVVREVEKQALSVAREEVNLCRRLRHDSDRRHLLSLDHSASIAGVGSERLGDRAGVPRCCFSSTFR